MGVKSILAGGVRLVRDRPATVLAWVGVQLAFAIAARAITQPAWGDMAMVQARVAAATPGAPPPDFPPGLVAAIVLWQLIFLVLVVALFAAVVRAVAQRAGGDRFAFLRLGMNELRMIGLAVVLWLLGMAALVIGAIPLVLLAVGAAFLVGPAATAAVAIVGYLALLAVLFWAEVRISLAGAYTVLRGRIVVREAWRATRGRFWTLTGVYLILLLGYTLVAVAFVALLYPQLFSIYADAFAGRDPTLALARQQAMLADPFSPRMIALMLLGAAMNGIGMAVAFGAVATAALEFDPAAAETTRPFPPNWR